MKDFGLLILDKPVGPTSHAMVSLVRRGTGIRKVGHAGTLDPRASGVLVLCLGAATRLSEFLSGTSKEYEAVIRFGASTRTFDTDGEITRSTGESPTRREVEAALPRFLGEILQNPPPFSAIKVQGRKAYEMARAGREVQLEPRTIHISRLDIHAYNPPDLSLAVDCSAGTYIRSLAHDLGEAVGTGAHLAALKRTRAGPFRIQEAIPLPMLEVGFLTQKWEQHVRPASDALPDLPVVQVGEDDIERIRFGHALAASPPADGLAKAVGPDGELLAILEAADGGSTWHPRKVFLG
jgi:tRNA pseudouridine55 synthase